MNVGAMKRQEKEELRLLANRQSFVSLFENPPEGIHHNGQLYDTISIHSEASCSEETHISSIRNSPVLRRTRSDGSMESNDFVSVRGLEIAFDTSDGNGLVQNKQDHVCSSKANNLDGGGHSEGNVVVINEKLEKCSTNDMQWKTFLKDSIDAGITARKDKWKYIKQEFCKVHPSVKFMYTTKGKNVKAADEHFRKVYRTASKQLSEMKRVSTNPSVHDIESSKKVVETLIEKVLRGDQKATAFGLARDLFFLLADEMANGPTVGCTNTVSIAKRSPENNGCGTEVSSLSSV